MEDLIIHFVNWSEKHYILSKIVIPIVVSIITTLIIIKILS